MEDAFRRLAAGAEKLDLVKRCRPLEDVRRLADALKVNTSLTVLYLGNNHIDNEGAASLADALKVNASLTELTLSSNNIGAEGAASLADALKVNASLTTLSLSSNRIADSEDATDKTCVLASMLHPRLKELRVRDNKLTRIPAEAFLAMPDDVEYDFYQNPWEYPPHEIVRQGATAIRDFLRKALKEGTVHCAVSKMMLVGLGRAGKTSFLNALCSADDVSHAIAHDNRTIGIDLADWHPDKTLVETVIDDSDRAAKLDGLKVITCDFAGQDEYGVTHQLFLTPRAFYVLVWDICLVDETEVAERYDLVDRWLESIHARSSGAQVLLLATHCSLVDEASIGKRCEMMAMHIGRALQRMRAAKVRQTRLQIEELEEQSNTVMPWPAWCYVPAVIILVPTTG